MGCSFVGMGCKEQEGVAQKEKRGEGEGANPLILGTHSTLGSVLGNTGHSKTSNRCLV